MKGSQCISLTSQVVTDVTSPFAIINFDTKGSPVPPPPPPYFCLHCHLILSLALLLIPSNSTQFSFLHPFSVLHIIFFVSSCFLHLGEEGVHTEDLESDLGRCLL